jgi:uncharacterized protein (TIGR02266 family)
MDESSSDRRRRRHVRIAVHVPVRVSTIDAETDPRTGRPFFRASREYCANLSRGGAFIRTRDPLSPGHRVLVEIHMPEGDPIETIGRVAWAKTVLGPGREPHESGVGVEFLGGSDDALVALERWLGAVGDGGPGGEAAA